MNKKILSLLIVFIMLPFSVFAVSLEQAVDSMVEKLAVEILVDSNILRSYYDHGYISPEYRQTVAAAIHSGLLIPDGRLINPEEENLLPLLNGFSCFSVGSKSYSVVPFDETVSVNHDTVYIKENEFVDIKEYGNSGGWALVTKGNVARTVWCDEKASAKAVFSAEVFLCDGDRIIFTNLKKYAFSEWQSMDDDKYYVISAGNIGEIDEEYVNSEMLDKRIMFVGEVSQNGEVKFLATNEKFTGEG